MGVRRTVFDVVGLKGASLSVTPSTNINALEATVRGSVARWALSAVLAAVVAGLLWAGFVSSAMAGETCANAAVRVQTGSTGLPNCRAYEMVSAPYKEGFGILPNAPVEFTDDGIVSYLSHGAFAGNVGGSPASLYHAFRSAAGWPTSSLEPPATIYGSYGTSLQAESADLRWSLWNIFRRSDESPGDESPHFGFWRRGPDDRFTRMGDGSLLVRLSSSSLPGVSVADLSHIVIGFDLAEYVGTGNDGPPRPVAVMNNGQPTPGVAYLNSVSSDGRVLVFGSASQVWARVDGSATVAVSASECMREADDNGGLCNGVSSATYVGGAVDGSRVFFTTRQQLVNGDIDTDDGSDLFAGNDLYACDIPAGTPLPVGSANPCDSLTKVSRTVPGAANDARVENVVSVSEDGSRVYFVARGVLADNLDVGGVGASAGAENLYLWDRGSGDSAGQTRYVARLASNDLTRAQMTPDGRYLLFVTANVLAGGDADDATTKDVYRYDATTHTIVRVSTSVAGGGGNGPGFDVSIPGKSAMSADGSTVIFDTAEALSPMDANGVGDVYSWRDGKVSLISADGGSTVGVTPSGRDLFFLTSAQVLSADRDINTDLYDARLGGGFAPTETPLPCFGDQCQGERSQAPSLAGPMAVGSGDGLGEVAPVFSVRAVSATQRRALAATGKVSLTVTANTAGTISARATATIAGRSVAVGSGRRTLANAGTVAVALTLSRKARAQLASRGRLTVKVAVSHSVVALDRSVTLKLVHAKAKAKAKRSVKRSARSVARVGGGQS
jgi:hypothetical protein